MSLEGLPGKKIDKEPTIEKTYRLESGVTVELAVKRFESKEKETEGTVVFLPGWGMTAGSAPMEEIAQAFADANKGETLVFTTRSQERGLQSHGESPNLIYEEARAIATNLRERNISEVTIAGHSQGGYKALDLAAILQNDDAVKVRGVVAIDAVGLYAQSPLKLAINFALDGIRDMTPDTAKWRMGAEIARVKGQEAIRLGMNFPRHFSSEVREMAQQNPHMAELRVPVIVVSGAQDLISSPQMIAPDESMRRVVSENDGERDVTMRAREAELKKNLFPNSPYIRMLTPEKAGSHGLPIHRPADVAVASLYLLKRYERNEK